MRTVPSTVFAAMVWAMAMSAPWAHAQTAMTEQADGSVAVSAQDNQILVPAAVVDRVEVAVRDYADDPEALRQAIEAIIAEYAPNPGDAALASAIAVLAIDRSRARSASVDAVIRGAFAANPTMSTGALLAVVPGLGASPRTQQAEERSLAQLQATVENPSQISPVQ